MRGITLNASGRGSAWLERLVRDQEVGGSNPLAPTNLFKHLQTLTRWALRQKWGQLPPDLQTPNNDIRVQKGSSFGPYSDPGVGSVDRCGRVLIDLLSDEFDDPPALTRRSGDAQRYDVHGSFS